MKRLGCLVLCATAFLVAPAHAHKPSDSYLSLDASSGGERVSGQWDIAVRDLEHAIGVDRDGDGAVTWGELRAREQAIVQFAFAHLAIRAETEEGVQRCPLAHEQLLVDSHVDGAYAVLRFHADCASPPSQVAVDYSLLFDLDPEHRSLLEVRTRDSSQALVLSHGAREANVVLRGAGVWKQLRSFMGEGVWHILHGYDHVLFVAGDADAIQRALDVVGGAPVLTVGEAARFAERGGMIGFRVTPEGRVGFDINLKRAERAGLRLRSQLLKLARIVGDAR